MELTNSEEIRRLLELFSSCSFKPKDSDKSADLVQSKCVQLFAKDYEHLALIPNENGELSTSYPSTLIVPQVFASSSSSKSCSNGQTVCSATNGSSASGTATTNGKSHGSETRDGTQSSFAVNLEAGKLRELMAKARVARCRARFPVPVILVDGKYICRSATLSGGPEIYGRSGLDLLFSSSNADEEESDTSRSTANATYVGSALNGSPATCTTSSTTNATAASSTHGQPATLPSLSSLSLGDSSQVFSKVRNQDINLLKYLSVKYICDLMVEKKKVKFGMNITSSEKADKEGRYADFEILSLPYPGCEFFRDYRDKGYTAEGLIFDWSQQYVDASLVIPPPDPYQADFMRINWTHYKSWDIIKLTRNYLKLLLHYLSESDSSMLVHCISGWDRTPLFISLLRLSLWADGKVHQNLSPLEITYLTVAYDWYLFGHNLTDRISKGEEILFFCFYFLKFITPEEYSLDNLRLPTDKESQTPPAPNSNGNHRSTESFKQHQNYFDSNNLEDSLVEEESVSLTINDSSCYMGSCTSLNSTCSIGSVKSQDTGPPVFFPCSQSDSSGSISFCCVDSMGHDVPDGVYPRTPPTLTNSEEGDAFLTNSNDDTDSSIETLVSFGNHFPKTTNKKTFTSDMASSPIEIGKLTCSSSAPSKYKSNPMEIPAQSISRGQRGRGRGTSLDGWQFVSETGSVRETTSARGFYSSPEVGSGGSGSSNHSGSNGNNVGDVRSSSKNGVCEAGSTDSKESPVLLRSRSNSKRNSFNSQRHARKEKLQAVRSIFYNAYSAAVGFRFKNGTEHGGVGAGLGSLFFGVGMTRVTAPH